MESNDELGFYDATSTDLVTGVITPIEYHPQDADEVNWIDRTIATGAPWTKLEGATMIEVEPL